MPGARRPQGRARVADVDSTGRYDWHDHRIHWMAQGTLPPQVKDEAQRTKIFDWKVPLAVGGRPAAITGDLTWVGEPGGGFPVAAGVALGVAVLAGGGAARGRRAPARAGPAAAGRGGLVRTRRLLARRCSPLLVVPAGGARPTRSSSPSTSPARGRARSKRAPGAVVFRFSEPVEAGFGAVRVFDADGERVDERRRSRARTARRALAVTLRGGLGDGTYTATYRVISADSHPVVRRLRRSRSGAAAPRRRRRVAELIDAGGAGPVDRGRLRDRSRARLRSRSRSLAGGAGVPLLVVAAGAAAGRPARGDAGATPPRRSRAALRRLLATALVARRRDCRRVGIVLQGATAGRHVASGRRSSPTVVADVLDTRFGTVWGLRLLAWAVARRRLAGRGRGRRGARAAAGVASAPPGSRRAARRRAGAGRARVCCGFLVALAGARRARRATDRPGCWCPPTSSTSLAMSVWVGGLVAAPAGAARRPRARSRRRTARRLLAACAEPLLAAGARRGGRALWRAGVLQAIVHLRSFGDLIDTAFGRAILIKIGAAARADRARRREPAARSARACERLRGASGEPPGGAGRAAAARRCAPRSR